MDIAQRSRLAGVDWLADGLIGPYADAFRRRLTEHRYAAHTIASYTAGISHFARWACTRHLPLRRIDEVAVAIFLDHRKLLAKPDTTDQQTEAVALPSFVIL